MIKWEHSLLKATICSSGTYKLEFDNGHQEIVDFVVGANDAWSCIRSLLSPSKPTYNGITYFDMTLGDVDFFPELSQLVGEGLTFIISDNRCLVAQRNSGSRMYLGVGEDWLEKESL